MASANAWLLPMAVECLLQDAQKAVQNYRFLMSTLINKILQLPVFIHLLALIVTSFLIGFGTLRYIDRYTNHNQAVHVPDVKGLQIEDAAPFLTQNFLRYTIIDSIHSKEVMPGAIVELLPEPNSRVKKNRIIYITVNAKSEKTAPIPEVADLSIRQAYSDMTALGFRYVETKYVSGEYRDLTVGVEYVGDIIDAGTQVPLSAKLTLVVQDGNVSPIEEEEDADETKKEPVKSDANWFE